MLRFSECSGVPQETYEFVQELLGYSRQRFRDRFASSRRATRQVSGEVNPPTTIAGMRAVLKYLLELDGHSDYLPTLLRSSILWSPVLAG